MEKDLLELKVFVSRSKLRVKVLERLSDGDQIASFLSKELGKHRESISYVFRDFLNKGLVKCVNPDDANFKRYRITELGKEVLKNL